MTLSQSRKCAAGTDTQTNETNQNTKQKLRSTSNRAARVSLMIQTDLKPLEGCYMGMFYIEKSILSTVLCHVL